MTATQAPTPGPLSGDEPLNVLLDRAVAAFKALPPEEQRRQFDEQKKNWVAAEMAWGDGGTRLCLAPTAPVEASGSEEIGDEYEAAAHCVTLAECPPGLFFWNGTLGFKSDYGAMEPVGSNFKTWKMGSRADAYCADSGEYFWGGTSNHDDRAKVLVMPIDAATVAMVASHGPAALRPQPSGETRALLERATEIANDVERGKRPKSDAVDMVRTLRDLLSARPLALGGQQGEDWTYCPECGSDEIGHEEGDHKQCGRCGQEWFSDIDYSDVVQKNLARLFTLSTTPARAEAQSDAPYAGITEEERRSWPPEPWGGIPNAEWVESYERWHNRYGPAALARRAAKKARAEAQDEGAAK